MPAFRECLPDMKEEMITGTTHFTVTLGERGATRVADLIVNFAKMCENAGSAGRSQI